MVTKAPELIDISLGLSGVDTCLLDVAAVEPEGDAASDWLTPLEADAYARLRHPGRRLQWLAARLCLKAMIVRRGFARGPLACAILQDERGKPRVTPLDDPRPLPDCSLAHAGRFAAACLATDAGTAVGIDIEEISPRVLNIARLFVHHDEWPSDQPLSAFDAARLWALKEAAAKAAGTGLAGALGSRAFSMSSPQAHTVCLDDAQEFEGRHTTHGSYVVAVCTGTRTNRPRAHVAVS